MKRKIDSLVTTPVEQIRRRAARRREVERVRETAERSRGGASRGQRADRPFRQPAGRTAKRNLPLLDVLLAYGADLNLKSAWWAGGFGLLEHDCTPDEAAPLIERGARGGRLCCGPSRHVRSRDASSSTPIRRSSTPAAATERLPLHCARTVGRRGIPARAWRRHRCPRRRSRVHAGPVSRSRRAGRGAAARRAAAPGSTSSSRSGCAMRRSSSAALGTIPSALEHRTGQG